MGKHLLQNLINLKAVPPRVAWFCSLISLHFAVACISVEISTDRQMSWFVVAVVVVRHALRGCCLVYDGCALSHAR